jgi:ABC-type phosphate transport system auxiliary subunit
MLDRVEKKQRQISDYIHDELTARATAANLELQRKVTRLTKVLTALTVVLVILTFILVFEAFGGLS